ncbi:MAG: VOC family protein [Actinomycetota bacterium]
MRAGSAAPATSEGPEWAYVSTGSRSIARTHGELARFWREALDYEELEDDDPNEVLLVPKDGSSRRLLLLKVPDEIDEPDESDKHYGD